VFWFKKGWPRHSRAWEHCILTTSAKPDGGVSDYGTSTYDRGVKWLIQSTAERFLSSGASTAPVVAGGQAEVVQPGNSLTDC